MSLIGVSQERAAELMTKSGPVVCLTIAKDAASFHDLDALLNKSPPPSATTATTTSHHHQALMHQSMISLSSGGNGLNPNFNSTMANTNNNNIAMTLPRNHQHFMMMNNQYQQQQQSPQQENSMSPAINGTTLISANNDSNNSGNRTRSMSQEILKSNSEMNVGITSPQVTTPLKPSLRQQQNGTNGGVTSPISTHQFPQRGLPNEQQIRYGSERPASNNQHHHQHHNHQLNMMNGGVMLATANGHIQQRNLPNELIPRFGSERPASSVSHMHQQQQYHQRLNGHTNGAELSPIKQQQLNMRARQASLSELDEINYNNNRQLQLEQHQQESPPLNGNNQFDDLYGKVRNPLPITTKQNNNNNNNQLVDERTQFTNGQIPSSLNGHHTNNINGSSGQQQYKTLPSRNGNINNVSLNAHLALNGINFINLPINCNTSFKYLRKKKIYKGLMLLKKRKI